MKRTSSSLEIRRFAPGGLPHRPMLDLLFVYGTLHPDHAPAEILPVARQLELVGEGSIHARKYQFARYPAILLDDSRSTVTRGHLFRVPESLWPSLDAYEGYEPNHPRLSLFVRKPITVQRDGDEPIEAWVYEYARPLPGSGKNGC